MTYENNAEINLAIAEGSKPSSPVDPVFIAAIHPLATTWTELGILHVEGANAIVVDVNERGVV